MSHQTLFRCQSYEYTLTDPSSLLDARYTMEVTSTLYRFDATLLREMMGVAAQPSVVRPVILMGSSAAAVALTGLSYLQFFRHFADSFCWRRGGSDIEG